MVLPFSQSDVRHHLHRFEPEDAHFVLTALTPIRPRREGLEKADYLSQGGRTVLGLGLDGAVVLFSEFYSCKFFDPVERRCTNYEGRPPMCRSYPWGGDPPDPAKALPPECEFVRDLGRVPVKLTVKP